MHQFTIAVELVEECRAGPLVRTFSCRCSPFYDLAPRFFGDAIGDCSFLFGSHPDLAFTFYFALPTTQVGRKQAQTIACACMHVLASPFVAAVYIRMQKFAYVCT